MTRSFIHSQLDLDMTVGCDKNGNEPCYCQAEIQLYRSEEQEWRATTRKTTNSSTRKQSMPKMTFWTRCLLALFLHIGCLAVDHRHRTSELTYEKDDLRLILGQSFSTSKLVGDESELSDRLIPDGSEILSFHPVSLDFKESTVGIPSLGVVRVDNKLTEESVKLISITGSTVHFHSSFFADKVISPGSNTTFEIVFLSRSEGLVDSNLYIQTSKGLFKYYVQGIGLPNPYRLKPLVGARIPVNGSYEPLITMHNPHGSRIQVVEILSSGSDFRLSLPEPLEGEEEGAWAIEPFQTKPVMKGTFQGKEEGNHTGYIKIRVNSTRTGSEYLLVPVEVQVSSSPGIYSPQESLDFGLLVKTDKPKTLSLSLINAQQLTVNVQSVTVKGSPNRAVKIEFRPISIEQDSTTSTVVALVTFDPSEIASPKDTTGFVEICSDHGNAITIPFRAVVLSGELEYNSSSLGFFVKANRYPTRNFSIRNTFPTAVAIYEVTLSHPEVLKLTNFNSGNGSSQIIVPAGEQVDLFRIKVKNPSDLCDPKSQIFLTLKSNVTTKKLPISCYDGTLQQHTLDGTPLKFGHVEFHSNHMEYFSVGNLNPVEVRLKSWGSNISWALVDLVGMKKGRMEDLAKMQESFDGLKKSLFLQPDHMAVFSVEVKNPTVEGVFTGESFVTTDHNQTLRVTFGVAVSQGSVQSDVLVFDKAFPGKISIEKLHLSSTFNQTVGLKNVSAGPAGVPLWFTSMSIQHLDILPQRKTLVGKVHFDPKQLCREECYSGFLLDSSMGKEWVGASDINWESAEVDWNILKKLQKRFEDVKEINMSNMTLWAETVAGHGFKIRTKANYMWPRITGSKAIVFPLTAIGNESYVDVPVHNPTSTPLFVQALMGSEYGPNWLLHLDGNVLGGNETEGAQVFTLNGLASDSSQSTEKSGIFTEVQRSIVGDFMETKPKVGVSFVIPPSAKFYLRCRFKPLSKQVASTQIIIRNNLTGVETVAVKGRAGTGLLTLGSGTPGSSLLFQITEKLLQGCEQASASKYLPPQLTVRRSFLARNVGDIPLNIDVVEIYPPQGYWPGFWTPAAGESCEGYGFRILNCNAFTLQPNETHSIDIAYTPDFTMSRIVRSLRLIDSNGGCYNYSLVAMVPSAMLDVCSTIITRPSWEPSLKYILFIVVFSGLIAGSCVSYFDSNHIVSQAILSTVRVRPAQDVGGQDETKMKLDLKEIYEKVDSRIRRNNQELLTYMPPAPVLPPSKTKPNQTPPQRSPPPQTSTPPSLPTPPMTTSGNASIPNSSSIQIQNRPEPPQPTTGLRNRKKNNQHSKTATYLSELNATNSTFSTAKWIKVEEKERQTESNVPPETKKYTEVIGKRKGKGQCNKPKVQTPPMTKAKSEEPEGGDAPSRPSTTSPVTVEQMDMTETNPSPVDLSVTSGSETVEGKSSKGSKKEKHFAKKQKSQGGNSTSAQFDFVKPTDPPKVWESKNNNGRNTASPPLALQTNNRQTSKQPLANSSSTNFEHKKAGSVKQKQLSGSSSSGSHGSGSPVDFPSRSGTPRLSQDGGQDGFLQRRASAGSGHDLHSSQFYTPPPPGYSAIPNTFNRQTHIYSQQFGIQTGMTETSLLQQQKTTYKNGAQPNGTTSNKTPRPRPGVIGQPRQTPTSTSMAQTNTGFVNGIPILTTLSMASTMTSNSSLNCHHSNVGFSGPWDPNRPSERGGPTRSSMELYPSSTSNSSIPSFGRPPPSSTPPTSANDIYNFSSALPSDLLSSLWQMNSFDRPPTSASQTQFGRNTQTVGNTTTHTSASSGTSRYLNGMATDTASGLSSYHPSTVDTNNHWPSSTFYQSRLDQGARNTSPPGFPPNAENSSTNAWSTQHQTKPSSPFDRAEYDGFGSGTGREARSLSEIWQNPQPARSNFYWSPQYLSETAPRPATTTNLAVTRPDPLRSNSGNGIELQNQREIEAGLGFNPFGSSDIWAPPEKEVKNEDWSAGSSRKQ